MFFWNSLAFSMIQRMLAIWSLVPLPFLKPAWTSESSWFTYCCSLVGEFWALLYQYVRWVQLCGSLSILWHCLSLGLEWKLTFPVLEKWPLLFSKFAGILSAALSQHHLSGFEIAPLEFHHNQGSPFCFSVSKLLDAPLGPISLLAPTPNLTPPGDCGPSQLPQERFSAPGPWGTTHPLTTADNSARGFLPPTQHREPICEIYSCLHLQPPS